MSLARQNASAGDSSPPPMQATEPPAIGRGHPEYHFVQSVMELRSAMHQMDTDMKVAAAKLESKIDHMNVTLESTKRKVDDLATWKAKILGGAIVVGIIISTVFGLAVKYGDRISITPPPQSSK